MNNFLAKIWGESEGFRCVVSGKKFSHDFLDDTVEVFKVPEKKDVWFAPAIFNTDQRKAENVISSRAFYLDIDCGKENGYENITEAAGRLKEFVDQLDLPSPTCVRSGNGLHVYFLLETAVGPEKWRRIAHALQLATADLGLKADHAVTKDIARILRVPGTFNYKDPKNPKPVELLTEITECTYEELTESLSEYLFQVELAETAKLDNRQFEIEYANTPKDAERISELCPQLRKFKETGGDIPEPVWYAGLGVLALCDNGLEIAQRWSSGHKDYSPRSTERKFERAREFAPTTCDKFRDVNPDDCKGCPFNGKITSPIQLGETVTEIVRPGSEIAADNIQSLAPQKLPAPLAPPPYKVAKEGVYIMIAATDDEPPQKERLLEHPLWVSRLMVGEDGKGTEIELTWINADGKTRKASIRTNMLASPQVFEGALRDVNIYFFWSIKTVLKYINDSVMHVARTSKEETVYGKFGFTDDLTGFVVGTDIIRSGGRENANISSRIDRKRVGLIAEKGTLTAWKNAGRLLDEPRLWMHRFTVLACLGTPLLALSGNEGSILSLAGESGGGKTTAANLGIAAFADPKAFTIDPQSTMKSFYEHWRQAGNLPVVVNEAATIRKEILTNLALAAANGKARDTMTQDGRLNDSGGWQTLTIFTSNIHLLDLSDKILTEASRRRILELSFTEKNKLSLSLGRPINDAIDKNYGIAGRLFMDYVMKHAEEVKELIEERVKKLEDGVDSVHRYNVWLIASASVAADIAEGLDLIDFETDDCISNAIRTLKRQAKEVKTSEEKVVELIGDYTSEFQQGIGNKGMGTGAWFRDPVGAAKGRYTSKDNHVFELALPLRQFKDYALDRGVDANQVREYMAAMDARETSVRLSREGGSVWCYVLPWRVEE
jgi:hypothetical protein